MAERFAAQVHLRSSERVLCLRVVSRLSSATDSDKLTEALEAKNLRSSERMPLRNGTVSYRGGFCQRDRILDRISDSILSFYAATFFSREPTSLPTFPTHWFPRLKLAVCEREQVAHVCCAALVQCMPYAHCGAYAFLFSRRKKLLGDAFLFSGFRPFLEAKEASLLPPGTRSRPGTLLPRRSTVTLHRIFLKKRRHRCNMSL